MRVKRRNDTPHHTTTSYLAHVHVHRAPTHRCTHKHTCMHERIRHRPTPTERIRHIFTKRHAPLPGTMGHLPRKWAGSGRVLWWRYGAIVLAIDAWRPRGVGRHVQKLHSMNAVTTLACAHERMYKRSRLQSVLQTCVHLRFTSARTHAHGAGTHQACRASLPAWHD